MDYTNKERIRSTILGALVADAASVGFHWLYDQERIRQIAPEAPEFRSPTQNDYEGFPGFYAHGHKRAGELSQYGEQAMVLLRSLSANNGQYKKKHYENLFHQHFGYGGGYVGYIDHPTRDTLDNITTVEHDALQRAEAIPFNGDSNSKHMMITKVLANVKATQGEELRLKVEEAVRQTHNDDEMVAYAFKIIAELENIVGYHGADDEQLPAISKLPPLVAVYAGKDTLHEVVESAVRVTNNNDLAVHFGQASGSIIEAAVLGTDVEAAILGVAKHADPGVAKLIDTAFSLRDKDNVEVTAKFGMSCNLVFGIPSVIHNIVTSDSFVQAIRQNIYAGGDSCGRAILLGAVLGATKGINEETGIPQMWIDNLSQKEEIDDLISKL